MKVHSPFNKPRSSGHPETSRLVTTYSLSFDENGNKKLVVKDVIDRYKVIQSFKDECDIENIVHRATITGDYSILNRSDPLYGDFSDLPSDFMQLSNVMKNAEDLYKNSFSEKFETFESFLDSFSSQEKFLENFGKKVDTVIGDPKEGEEINA